MIEVRRRTVRTLASGDAMAISVYTVKGRNPRAPRAYVQSSMHGAEVQGNAVIAELLAHFERQRPEGDVVLVPNANPYAVNQKSAEYTLGRFDPTTGANWNRNYWLATIGESRRPCWSDLRQLAWRRMARDMRARLSQDLSAAQHLALTLQLLAVGADCVIDLHCANVSVRHLYAPEHGEEAARHFGIPLMLSIPNTFDGALDESVSCPWWQFWGALREEGYADLPPASDLPQGFTLELGSHEAISRQDARHDAAGVLDFLRHKGVVRGAPRRPGPGYICALEHYRTLHARHAGHVDFTVRLGSPVPKGARLLQTLQFGRSPAWVPTFAEERCIPILRHSSAVVHEGVELMKVFTRVRRV